MDWTDEGIVLGVRRHGEANAILEVMTREHGRHLGLVRGGAGSRMRPVLQPGNDVRLTWRARLDEHLGHFVVEGLRLRAAELMVAAHAAYGVTHLAALCRLLPERDPHEEVHATLAQALDHMQERTLAPRWSRASNCSCSPNSASGSISTNAPRPARPPSSSTCRRSRAARCRVCGRAVARPHAAAAAVSRAEWEGGEPVAEELSDAFALTGFFLERTCSSRAGCRCTMRARASSMRCCAPIRARRRR